MLSIFIYSLVGRWPCNTIQNRTQQGRGPLCELQKGFHLWANLESNYSMCLCLSHIFISLSLKSYYLTLQNFLEMWWLICSAPYC